MMGKTVLVLAALMTFIMLLAGCVQPPQKLGCCLKRWTDAQKVGHTITEGCMLYNATDFQEYDYTSETNVPCDDPDYNTTGLCNVTVPTPTGDKQFLIPICTQNDIVGCINGNCTAMVCGDFKFKPAAAPGFSSTAEAVNAAPASSGKVTAMQFYKAQCRFLPMDAKLRSVMKSTKSQINVFRMGVGGSFDEFDQYRYYFPISDKYCSINQPSSPGQILVDRYMNYLTLSSGTPAQYNDPIGGITSNCVNDSGAVPAPLAFAETAAQRTATYPLQVAPGGTFSYSPPVPDTSNYKFADYARFSNASDPQPVPVSLFRSTYLEPWDLTGSQKPLPCAYSYEGITTDYGVLSITSGYICSDDRTGADCPVLNPANPAGTCIDSAAPCFKGAASTGFATANRGHDCIAPDGRTCTAANPNACPTGGPCCADMNAPCSYSTDTYLCVKKTDGTTCRTRCTGTGCQASNCIDGGAVCAYSVTTGTGQYLCMDGTGPNAQECPGGNCISSMPCGKSDIPNSICMDGRGTNAQKCEDTTDHDCIDQYTPCAYRVSTDPFLCVKGDGTNCPSSGSTSVCISTSGMRCAFSGDIGSGPTYLCMSGTGTGATECTSDSLCLNTATPCAYPSTTYTCAAAGRGSCTSTSPCISTTERCTSSVSGQYLCMTGTGAGATECTGSTCAGNTGYKSTGHAGNGYKSNGYKSYGYQSYGHQSTGYQSTGHNSTGYKYSPCMKEFKECVDADSERTCTRQWMTGGSNGNYLNTTCTTILPRPSGAICANAYCWWGDDPCNHPDYPNCAIKCNCKDSCDYAFWYSSTSWNNDASPSRPYCLDPVIATVYETTCSGSPCAQLSAASSVECNQNTNLGQPNYQTPPSTTTPDRSSYVCDERIPSTRYYYTYDLAHPVDVFKKLDDRYYRSELAIMYSGDITNPAKGRAPFECDTAANDCYSGTCSTQTYQRGSLLEYQEGATVTQMSPVVADCVSTKDEWGMPIVACLPTKESTPSTTGPPTRAYATSDFYLTTIYADDLEGAIKPATNDVLGVGGITPTPEAGASDWGEEWWNALVNWNNPTDSYYIYSDGYVIVSGYTGEYEGWVFVPGNGVNHFELWAPIITSANHVTTANNTNMSFHETDATSGNHKYDNTQDATFIVDSRGPPVTGAVFFGKTGDEQATYNGKNVIGYAIAKPGEFGDMQVVKNCNLVSGTDYIPVDIGTPSNWVTDQPSGNDAAAEKWEELMATFSPYFKTRVNTMKAGMKYDTQVYALMLASMPWVVNYREWAVFRVRHSGDGRTDHLVQVGYSSPRRLTSEVAQAFRSYNIYDEDMVDMPGSTNGELAGLNWILEGHKKGEWWISYRYHAVYSRYIYLFTYTDGSNKIGTCSVDNDNYLPAVRTFGWCEPCTMSTLAFQNITANATAYLPQYTSKLTGTGTNPGTTANPFTAAKMEQICTSQVLPTTYPPKDNTTCFNAYITDMQDYGLSPGTLGAPRTIPDASIIKERLGNYMKSGVLPVLDISDDSNWDLTNHMADGISTCGTGRCKYNNAPDYTEYDFQRLFGSMGAAVVIVDHVGSAVGLAGTTGSVSPFRTCSATTGCTDMKLFICDAGPCTTDQAAWENTPSSVPTCTTTNGCSAVNLYLCQSGGPCTTSPSAWGDKCSKVQQYCAAQPAACASANAWIGQWRDNCVMAGGTTGTSKLDTIIQRSAIVREKCPNCLIAVHVDTPLTSGCDARNTAETSTCLNKTLTALFRDSRTKFNIDMITFDYPVSLHPQAGATGPENKSKAVVNDIASYGLTALQAGGKPSMVVGFNVDSSDADWQESYGTLFDAVALGQAKLVKAGVTGIIYSPARDGGIITAGTTTTEPMCTAVPQSISGNQQKVSQLQSAWGISDCSGSSLPSGCTASMIHVCNGAPCLVAVYSSTIPHWNSAHPGYPVVECACTSGDEGGPVEVKDCTAITGGTPPTQTTGYCTTSQSTHQNIQITQGQAIPICSSTDGCTDVGYYSSGSGAGTIFCTSNIGYWIVQGVGEETLPKCTPTGGNLGEGVCTTNTQVYGGGAIWRYIPMCSATQGCTALRLFYGGNCGTWCTMNRQWWDAHGGTSIPTCGSTSGCTDAGLFDCSTGTTTWNALNVFYCAAAGTTPTLNEGTGLVRNMSATGGSATGVRGPKFCDFEDALQKMTGTAPVAVFSRIPAQDVVECTECMPQDYQSSACDRTDTASPPAQVKCDDGNSCEVCDSTGKICHVPSTASGDDPTKWRCPAGAVTSECTPCKDSSGTYSCTYSYTNGTTQTRTGSLSSLTTDAYSDIIAALPSPYKCCLTDASSGINYSYSKQSSEGPINSPITFTKTGDPNIDCGMGGAADELSEMGSFCGYEIPIKQYDITCTVSGGGGGTTPTPQEGNRVCRNGQGLGLALLWDGKQIPCCAGTTTCTAFDTAACTDLGVFHSGPCGMCTTNQAWWDAHGGPPPGLGDCGNLDTSECTADQVFECPPPTPEPGGTTTTPMCTAAPQSAWGVSGNSQKVSQLQSAWGISDCSSSSPPSGCYVPMIHVCNELPCTIDPYGTAVPYWNTLHPGYSVVACACPSGDEGGPVAVFDCTATTGGTPPTQTTWYCTTSQSTHQNIQITQGQAIPICSSTDGCTDVGYYSSGSGAGTIFCTSNIGYWLAQGVGEETLPKCTPTGGNLGEGVCTTNTQTYRVLNVRYIPMCSATQGCTAGGVFLCGSPMSACTTNQAWWSAHGVGSSIPTCGNTNGCTNAGLYDCSTGTTTWTPLNVFDCTGS